MNKNRQIIGELQVYLYTIGQPKVTIQVAYTKLPLQYGFSIFCRDGVYNFYIDTLIYQIIYVFLSNNLCIFIKCMPHREITLKIL